MGTHRPSRSQNVQFRIQRQSRHRKQIRMARLLWRTMSTLALESLRELVKQYDLSVSSGDLVFLKAGWYVTHAGLLRLARRSHCIGIDVAPVAEFSNPATSRWAFKATVYKSPQCRGFVGYGDADPTNVSPLVHGAEMRVAETRAVNRALRKAYGIGICSVEEISSFAEPASSRREAKKLPPQPVNGNYGGPKVRDRLLIRQHQLDATLVKSYAVDFCGTKTLREASREQVENFVVHLADWAEKDRNALLCQLNSYLGSKEGAAYGCQSLAAVNGNASGERVIEKYRRSTLSSTTALRGHRDALPTLKLEAFFEQQFNLLTQRPALLFRDVCQS